MSDQLDAPKNAVAVNCAAIGLLLIAGGTFFALAAPNDGQTGMIVFPGWAAGGFLGLIALVSVWTRGTPRCERRFVFLCAGFAFFVLSFTIWVLFQPRTEPVTSPSPKEPETLEFAPPSEPLRPPPTDARRRRTSTSHSADRNDEQVPPNSK